MNKSVFVKVALVVMFIGGLIAGTASANTKTWYDYSFNFGERVVGTDQYTSNPCEDFYYGTTQDWDGHDGWCEYEEATIAAALSGDARFSPGVTAMILRAQEMSAGRFGSPVSILD